MDPLFTPALPIDPVLPDVVAALARAGRAVLQAPPGAGKTTRVPLALLAAGVTGRIVMLEPRRLATRAAAERMAQTLGEPLGKTVGYRMRGEAKVSQETRIEVVTEGILTRMIQSDPALPGVGAVIFDEFHERSLQADLGLALTIEARAALRPDLQLLVMSATLDAAPVAALLDNAPLITSEGKSFAVETIWLDRPTPRDTRLEAAMADLVSRAVAETEGGVLVFLPGEGEIRRLEAVLAGRLPSDCVVRPLFGAMPFAAQRAAIEPPAKGRKVVLATAIAETSLTIPDIRVVVDAGLARRSRYDPASGMARLVTERVTRAEATQRMGRAGRVAEGRCYRLWTRGEEGGLAAFPPPEIAAGDLTPLALDLALWGSDDLAFLTPPPEATLAEARALLHDLGALDPAGRITTHGRQLAAMPLHPRLAHMLAIAGAQAAPLAALLADRDPMRGSGADVLPRLAALRGERGNADRATLDRIRTEAQRLAKGLPEGGDFSPAQMAALAYPDRIGQRRAGTEPRYLLAGGKGAIIDSADALAGQKFIVATDLDGDPREARVRAAIALGEGELREVAGARIERFDMVTWSRREGRVLTRRQERLGALILGEQNWPEAPSADVARAMLEGVRELGITAGGAAALFVARVQAARAGGIDLPDCATEVLLAKAEEWLLPYLTGLRTAEQWRRFDLLPALRARLDWGQMQALDAAAPAHFETPLGRRIAIDYAAAEPEITLRLQEMFGVTRHPVIAGRALRVTLLSPGGKPVQTTTDIPGFWRTSYADVRKDMRGRYPRHPWPEDPTEAEPTLRAKPRGT